eukprot:6303073-Amphidinium_carterae.1
MAVWVAVNLNILQANLQSCQTTPLLPERINVVASGTCQPSHNRAWLDRLWWTPVARKVILNNRAWLDRLWRKPVTTMVSLPSTKGRYRQCVRVGLAASLHPQVAGSSPGHDRDSREYREDSSELRADSRELRGHSSELRADSSELRADSSELRRHSSELRADSSELRADS